MQFSLRIFTDFLGFLLRISISADFVEINWPINPAGIYLFKVNNGNTRTRCEICSELTIKTPERRHWRCFGVFIVNFGQISHLVLVFLLLTLNICNCRLRQTIILAYFTLWWSIMCKKPFNVNNSLAVYL